MSFNRSDPTDLATLKNEVLTDPQSIGYAATQDEHGGWRTQQLLDLLNGKTLEKVAKPKISPANVRSAVTFDAYNALSIDEQEWIRWMTGSNGATDESLVVTTDLRTRLTGPGAASIWAAAQRDAMNQAMLDIIDVDGSRIEILFGYGCVVSRDDLNAALQS